MTTDPQVTPNNQARRLSALPADSPNPSAGASQKAGPPDPPEPPDVGILISDFNAQNRQHEDLWTRVLHAVHAVRDAAKSMRAAVDLAREMRLTWDAIQAEDPDRRAHRLRQLALAVFTVFLDGIACNFAAQALGNNQLQTYIWTALFLAVLAGGEFALDHYAYRNRRVWRAVVILLTCFIAGLGVLRFSYLITVGTDSLLAALVGAVLFTVATGVFVTVGYWALRRAETPRTARARRRAQRASSDARASQEQLILRQRDRDRLIDAYVVRLKACLLQGYPAGQVARIEAALRKHLIGEERGE
jgi:hypothetical protein